MWCYFRQSRLETHSAWAGSARQGEVGGWNWRVWTAWPCLGSAKRDLGWHLVAIPHLGVPCTNGLWKQSSYFVGLPFLAVKAFPSLDEQSPAESHDYWKLVRGWVRFKSQTFKGWLIGHLCRVWGLR